MQLNWRYYLLLLLLPICTTAQTQQSLLWRVSGNQLKSSSYIFGTFHLLCPNQFKLPDTLTAIIQSVDTVYFEIKLDDPALFNNMLQEMTMQIHQSLQNLMALSTYDSINRIFQEKTKMNLNFFQFYKPILITSFLYPALMGCTPISLETEIQKIANKKNIPIAGLETADFQFKILDEIPYQQQANMLKETLLYFNRSQTELKNMVAMYQRMNIDSIQQSVGAEDDLVQYQNELIIQRNKNWVTILNKWLPHASCFIAVGAGHLGGEQGLIALLRKAGYTVTPILF
ncbi:TraB/GumN family protein [Hydrotalea sp.]|uniref:TraB/GumN family protein n=1 Tax=Hydrotalea sp. TaxID=2881279 RepID=UPI00260D32EE|nr:TraB/GumN family protein [Hydrotalea sp.]